MIELGIDPGRCPNCGHLPGCLCPEPCEQIIEDEARRIADLAAFFDVPGYQPLASRYDSDPFAMFDAAEGAA